MALETFSTGRYSATYNTNALGVSREGYRFSHETKAANIDQTDAYGDSLIDMIYRGAGLSVSFTMLSAAKATTALILCPWTDDLSILRSTAKPIGRLASDFAKALVLTAEANTPAAANGPASLTATYAILSPGSVEMVFDSKLREVPVRMTILPYDASGTGAGTPIRFYTIT